MYAPLTTYGQNALWQGWDFLRPLFEWPPGDPAAARVRASFADLQYAKVQKWTADAKLST